MTKYENDLKLAENYYNNLKKKVSFSKDDLINIVKGIHNGESRISLGKKYGISGSTITHHLKKANIHFTNKYNPFPDGVPQEILDRIIEMYNLEIPLYKIGEELGIQKNRVSDILRENDIDPTKPTFDIHVFDKIDTEEKAYWLGFLFADGYVSKDPRNEIEISLQLLDVEHLYKFKNFLKSKNRVILDYKVGRCRFVVTNKHFKQTLKSLGCVNNKSLILEYPKIDKSLERHFIRGYFDGDGSLTYAKTNKNKDNDKITISCSFIGTENFLSGIANFTNIKTSTPYLYDKAGENTVTYIMEYSKHRSVNLVELLYEDSTIYLNRKYNRYIYFKNNNYAVYKRDFIDNDRAISEKAENFIKENYANPEIS